MNCRDIENNLPAYLENLLSQEEKRKVREHLISCRRCSKTLEDLNQVEALLQDLDEVAPPPWLKQKIMARVREEAPPEKGFFRKLFSPLYFKIPLSTVALLLMSVLAFYVYRGQEPELQKEGINIALPPPVQQQRIEKQEPPRTASSGTVPSQAASSLTASPRTAPSRPVSSQSSLPREMPPPRESKSREQFKSEREKPAEQAVLALKKDVPPKREGETGKGKGPCATGQTDSAGLQGETVNDARLTAPWKDSAVSLREAEKAPGCAAPQPALSGAHARSKAGSREGKAESAVTAAPFQERDSNMPVSEILGLLRQFDASKIDRRTVGEREILTAELPQPQVIPLLQKLETRGLSGKNVSIGAADAQKGIVKIRIEIFKKP